MLKKFEQLKKASSKMSSTPISPTRNHSMASLRPNGSLEDLKKEEVVHDAASLQSYHMWLKEKQIESEAKKGKHLKDEEEDSGEETFRVDAVLERGPSPPESENSNSYEWSYEEQFKQLYEIDSDPERKTFLDEYFEFMKSKAMPVSRIPIMAKQILDLYQLYNLVVKHGGLVQVIRNKQWSKITKGLNLPTSITSAAFTLRTQYLKYLYSYECTMHNFSTPKELQTAIDSNRRDRFSNVYYTEPTMTSSTRDDRFVSYAMNGCDYPSNQTRHHMPHPVMASSQMDMRYGLKRHSDSLKPYDKYMESPKVIVLQDGNPTMADGRQAKVSPPPPPFHPRSRSPNEMRTLAEIEVARRRGHHMGYPTGKDWEGEARHVIEEETRRRLLDETRSRSTVCKDKSCNGFDCQFPRPDLHRHTRHDSSMLAGCHCTYCKEYRSNYSPISRHHMDGASANSYDRMSPRADKSTPSPNSMKIKEGDDGELTTLKIKMPDLRKGGNNIQISLEVGGVLYEGVMTAQTPLATVTNGVKHEGANDDEKVGI